MRQDGVVFVSSPCGKPPRFERPSPWDRDERRKEEENTADLQRHDSIVVVTVKNMEESTAFMLNAGKLDPTVHVFLFHVQKL